MGSLSAAASLLLPVQLRGIQLGRPIDLLLDLDQWNLLGFVVLCGDESRRFLPLAASQVLGGEIAVGSALMLLEDVEFYRRRTRSLRALLGAGVASRGRAVGPLYDLVVADDGAVASLLIARDGGLSEVEPAGARIELAPAA